MIGIRSLAGGKSLGALSEFLGNWIFIIFCGMSVHLGVGSIIMDRIIVGVLCSRNSEPLFHPSAGGDMTPALLLWR